MSNASGMKPIASEDTDNYIKLFAYDISNNLEYIGKAVIGSAADAAVWQIRKATYDSNNNLINIKWADSYETFNKIWDSRATYTYG